MIPVKKSYHDVPVGLENATAKKKQLMIEGNNHEAASSVYAHDSVKAALNTIYGEKCAYCECVIAEQADRRVDHYRPKKARKTGETHPGYYWLTYEWSNLVLACSTCNGKKSNHFPVAGVRVTSPPPTGADWMLDSAPMRGEQSLLLNPEIDDPAQHLEFSPDGDIHGKSDRGIKTIQVCKLDREPLYLARKKLMDGLRNELKKQAAILLLQHREGLYLTREAFSAALILGFGTIVEKIKAAKEANQPFSRVGWHLNDDPEKFLLADIEQEEPRRLVRTAFKRLHFLIAHPA